jgi:phage shock protein A
LKAAEQQNAALHQQNAALHQQELVDLHKTVAMLRGEVEAASQQIPKSTEDKQVRVTINIF